MDARVGGGQLLDLLASTSISWSGRFVLTDRWFGCVVVYVHVIVLDGC